jgi:hypothetical protein
MVSRRHRRFDSRAPRRLTASVTLPLAKPGRSTMHAYRLYCLGRDGRITHRHDFEAADDNAATAVAGDLHSASDCELWSGARWVAALPAGRGAPLWVRPDGSFGEAVARRA